MKLHMKIICLTFLALFFVLVGMAFTSSSNQANVLGIDTTPTPTLVPTSTPSSFPSPTATPRPTLKPTATPIPTKVYVPPVQESSDNQVQPVNDSNDDYYTNVDGNQVHVPDANSSGASARCRDGTFSHSLNRRGTCSGHGGVAEWL